MAAPAPAAPTGGAGGGGGGGAAAAAAAAAPAAGGDVISYARFQLKRFYDYIVESRKEKPLTLDQIIALVNKHGLQYTPAPWLTDLHTGRYIDDTEYNEIILSGKRSMIATLAIIRNFAAFMTLHRRKGWAPLTDNLLRDAAIRVFNSILIYHVYTYFKIRRRKDAINLALTVNPNANIAAESQLAAGPIILPKVENMYQLSDSLNNVLIGAYSTIAASFGIEAGLGVGKSAQFPNLKLVRIDEEGNEMTDADGNEIELDASEASDEEIAVAMEKYIRKAEDYLDKISAGGPKKPRPTDEGRRNASGGFAGALKALTDARAGRLAKREGDDDFGIIAAIRALVGGLVGVGEIAGAMAGNGAAAGASNYSGIAVRGSEADQIGPVLGLLADPPAAAAGGAGAGVGAIDPDIVGMVLNAAISPIANAAAAATDAAHHAITVADSGDEAAAAALSALAEIEEVGEIAAESAAGPAARSLLKSVIAPVSAAAASGGGGGGGAAAAAAPLASSSSSGAVGAEARNAGGAGAGAGTLLGKRPPSERPGQGGGARRTLRRRLRHHKTRRHAHKHRSHKAKTHHRSRASRRHSRR